MPKLNFKNKSEKYIARCQDCSYHSPRYRDTEEEAAKDAVRHKSQPGNHNHVVEIFEEIVRIALIK